MSGYSIPENQMVQLVMTDDGSVKQVMLRRPTGGQVAVVDWVNFVIGEETFSSIENFTDDDYIRSASERFEEIFGFGITSHLGKPRNFYGDSWILGDGCGFVCYGKQNSTMLVMLSGQGCSVASAGWEKRLYSFLTTEARRPKISRIDLAHDDLSGERISVDWADAQDQVRGFCCTSFGQPPIVQHLGAWRRPSGKGRTLTSGLRTSGKHARIYEKGKKEGDRNSDWCRFEIEFKAIDRVIPFDALLDPSAYFIAAYPCLAFLAHTSTPARMEIRKKTAQVIWQFAVQTTRDQFGRYITAFRQFYQDDSKLLDMLTDGKTEWPKRLLTISQSIETISPGIHRTEKVIHLNDAQFERHLDIAFLQPAL